MFKGADVSFASASSATRDGGALAARVGASAVEHAHAKKNIAVPAAAKMRFVGRPAASRASRSLLASLAIRMPPEPLRFVRSVAALATGCGMLRCSRRGHILP